MSNYDSDILIENIKSHMNEKGITQEKLANILGMSQSNVSKALSTKDKKSFTLDQVVGIAKFFRVSVDSLIGREEQTKLSTSPRSIAAFLAQLIESNDAELIPYEKEEEISFIDYDTTDGYPDCRIKKEKVKYPAFYLPSYWYIPDGLPRDRYEELASEWSQIGNDTSMLAVNKFLNQFVEIYSIYKSKGLSEETYRSVLSDMLSHLRN